MEIRDTVTLKSGRTVYRDEARDAWGEFIAPLRPWSYFVTLTYDQERWRERVSIARQKLGYRDGISEKVVLETTVKHFREWANAARMATGVFEYVDAVELQKNGWPHHHALVDVGRASMGDIARMHQLWFSKWGYIRAEVPRSREDTASYAAKYLSKDLDRGAVLLSAGLRDISTQPNFGRVKEF